MSKTQVALAFALTWCALYLIGSFMAATLDVVQWHYGLRATIGVCAAIAFLIAIAALMATLEQEAKERRCER